MKYVDDTTVYTFSGDLGDMSLQFTANDLAKWSHTNGLVINEYKKEMVIYFGGKFNKENDIPNNAINNRVIDRVASFKLLIVYISPNLSWNFHIDYIVKKVVERIFCIRTIVQVETDLRMLFKFTVLLFAPVWNMPALYGILA
jgi:hypothetical protein